MSDRNEIERITVNRIERADALDDPFNTATASSGNPVALVMDRLAGRWWWALGLAIVLAPVLAFLGYKFAPVKFTSRGLVKVESQVTPLVHAIPETDSLVMYRPYMMTQAGMLQSEEVLSMAVNQLAAKGYEEMKKLGALEELADAVEVTTGRESFLISVAVEHEDRQFARDAAQSVLEAYMKNHNAKENYEAKIADLIAQMDKKKSEIQETESRKAVFVEGSKYAAKPIEEQKQLLFQQLLSWQQQLYAVEQALISVNRADNPDTEEDEQIASFQPTEQDLNETDPMLMELRQRVQDLEFQLEQIRGTHGPNSRLVYNANRNLDAARQSLAARLEYARMNWISDGAYGGTGSLPQRKERITQEIARIEQALTDINREAKRLREYDVEIASLGGELAIVDERYRQLQSEHGTVAEGRVHVFSNPKLPGAPSTDRRYQLGAIGFLAGLAFPFGAFFLLGSMDRRAYATAQLQGPGHENDCLGVLPDMRVAAPDDEESRDLASQCVHRIRNRIETLRAPGAGYVATITSPSQGDGKTSLALALGWSYAASGCKTILVDCDFIGRSLSLQTDRLGQSGVKEVLRTQQLNGEISTLSETNLSVLGIGNDPSMGPESVRRSDFEFLFDELRKRFDMVIVDTGPMLASVESLPISTCSDGVVLALKRGRSQRRLDECVRELRRIGASYLGVVFNRANHAECMRYSSVSRVSKEVDAFDRARRDGEPGVSTPAAGKPNTLMRALQASAEEQSSNSQS